MTKKPKKKEEQQEMEKQKHKPNQEWEEESETIWRTPQAWKFGIRNQVLSAQSEHNVFHEKLIKAATDSITKWSWYYMWYTSGKLSWTDFCIQPT